MLWSTQSVLLTFSLLLRSKRWRHREASKALLPVSPVITKAPSQVSDYKRTVTSSLQIRKFIGTFMAAAPTAPFLQVSFCPLALLRASLPTEEGGNRRKLREGEGGLAGVGIKLPLWSRLFTVWSMQAVAGRKEWKEGDKHVFVIFVQFARTQHTQYTQRSLHLTVNDLNNQIIIYSKPMLPI